MQKECILVSGHVQLLVANQNTQRLYHCKVQYIMQNATFEKGKKNPTKTSPVLGQLQSLAEMH